MTFAPFRRAVCARAQLAFTLATVFGVLGACGSEAPAVVAEGQGLVTQTLRKLESELWRMRSERDSAAQTAPASTVALRVDELLFALTNGTEARTAAALERVEEGLRRLGCDALTRLRTRLRDTHATREERSAAAQALAATRCPEAAEELLGLLELQDGPPGDSAWLRGQCAWHLAEMALDWTVPRLLLCLREEPDAEVAIRVAEALRANGNLTGLEILDRIASSQDERAREAAATLGEWALELECEDEQALRALWESGEASVRMRVPPQSLELQVDVWRRIASLGQWDRSGADEGRYVLARMNNSVLEPLTRALADAQPATRAGVAHVLGDMGTRARASVPTLLAAWTTAADTADERAAIATALGRIGDVRAAPQFVALLESGSDGPFLRAVARASGGFAGGPAGNSLYSLTARLREALDDAPSPELATACALSLVHLAPPAAAEGPVQVLARRLASATNEAGAEAAEAAVVEAALTAWVETLSASGAAGELRAQWARLATAHTRDPARRQAERAALLVGNSPNG